LARDREDKQAPRDELENLRVQVRELRAELGVRRELDEVKQQVDVMRSGKLVDVTPARKVV
jgi:hypothetical protein